MEKQHNYIIITQDDDIDSRKIIYNNFRNNIVSNAIRSNSGKAVLAAAMANPIRRNLDYQGIARSCFTIQQLPPSANYYYEAPAYKDETIVINSYDEIGERGLLSYRWVTIPQFEIVSNPTVRISDIKSRRFNLIDRSVSKTNHEIMAQEDVAIFDALDVVNKVAENKPKEQKKKSLIGRLLLFIRKKFIK